MSADDEEGFGDGANGEKTLEKKNLLIIRPGQRRFPLCGLRGLAVGLWFGRCGVPAGRHAGGRRHIIRESARHQQSILPAARSVGFLFLVEFLHLLNLDALHVLVQRPYVIPQVRQRDKADLDEERDEIE